MYFSGQSEPTGAIQCAIQYKPGSEDGDLIALFAHAIRALVAVVYKARTTDVSGRPDANRWTSEFLLGYAILTVNEARSLLLLLGGGLNRHARIHGRSLWEHELHARRLVEEETNGLALKLRDAYAFEARVFGNLTDADPNAVERSIAHAIGVDDSALIRGDQERRVFGGDGRAAMKDEASPDKRYAGTVKWMGQVAHGSVLAINEIANATNGAKNDTFERAALEVVPSSVEIPDRTQEPRNEGGVTP